MHTFVLQNRALWILYFFDYKKHQQKGYQCLIWKYQTYSYKIIGVITSAEKYNSKSMSVSIDFTTMKVKRFNIRIQTIPINNEIWIFVKYQFWPGLSLNILPNFTKPLQDFCF